MEPTENTNIEDSNTAPTIREEVVSTLTDAEVLEWMRRALENAKAARTRISVLKIEARKYDHYKNARFDFEFYAPEADVGGSVLASDDKSVSRALDSAIKQIDDSSPAKFIAEKRAAAARLLAEAAALEGKIAAAA